LSLHRKDVEELRSFLENILITENPNQQPDFWCKFCQQEVVDHTEPPLVVCGHIFAHWASHFHREQTETFFREQGADKNLKDIFLLPKETYNEFRKKSAIKLKEFKEQHKPEPQNEKIDSLYPTTQIQGCLGLYPFIYLSPSSFPSSSSSLISAICYFDLAPMTSNSKILPSSSFKDDFNVIPLLSPIQNVSYAKTKQPVQGTQIKTLKATGEGLTPIQVPELLPTEKNVHDPTSVPPWLMNSIDEKINESSSEKSDQEYGPSMLEFQKHKEIEKKKKLNPKRLGANFDRDAPIGPNWLPSFGRVWGKGSRKKERNQFQQDKN